MPNAGPGPGELVVVATGSPHKLAELRTLTARLDWQLVGLHELVAGGDDLPEPGPTLRDNALAKAAAAFARTGRPALADDTTLEVDALGGAPGLHTARFAGPGASAGARNERLLAALAGVPAALRTARFRCVLVLERGDARWLGEGVTEGRIAIAPRGRGGFGYDPLFVPAGETATYAELEPARLDTLGHRARAFAALAQQLGHAPSPASRAPGEARR